MNKHYPVALLLAALLLTPALTHAQSKKTLTVLLEKSLQSTSEPASRAAMKNGLINAMQNINTDKILADFSRSITKDPSYIYSKRFAQQWESLQKLGVELDDLPKLNSLRKKSQINQFNQAVETELNRALEEAGKSPIRVSNISIDTRKALISKNRKSPNKYTAMQKNPRDFKWGMPGLDEVILKPASYGPAQMEKFRNISSFSYSLGSINFANMREMLNFVVGSTELNLKQKTDVILHLSAMKEVMDFDLLQTYLQVNKTLPTIVNMSPSQFTNDKALAQYADYEIKRLVASKIDHLTPVQPEEFAKALVLQSFISENVQPYLMVTLLRKDFRLLESLLNGADQPLEQLIQAHNLWGYLTDNHVKPVALSYQAAREQAASRLSILEDRFQKLSYANEEVNNMILSANAEIELAKAAGNPKAANAARSRRLTLDNKSAQLKELITKLMTEYKDLTNKYNL